MTPRFYSTDTPGLVAAKIRDGWAVVHEPSGRTVIASRDENRFPRLRDARAAAVRLAPILDWTRSFAELAPKIGGHAWSAEKRAVFDALTNTTAEERRSAREQRRREASGEDHRGSAHQAAGRLGHDLDWRRYGVRSWRGRCRLCRSEVRIAYCANRRRYFWRGDAFRESCTASK